MPDSLEHLAVLKRHGVEFVVVGGYAVTFHGFLRATEDIDIVWLRSPASESALLAALTEMEARYIGSEIDPATGIERDHLVAAPYIAATRLMMLTTRLGFIDLFDYVPGLPDVDPKSLLASSVESNGYRYASRDMLREMKKATGRPKDLLDLDNLP